MGRPYVIILAYLIGYGASIVACYLLAMTLSRTYYGEDSERPAYATAAGGACDADSSTAAELRERIDSQLDALLKSTQLYYRVGR